MTITLELPADIEKELQAAAAREGVKPQQIVIEALASHLRDAASPVHHLPSSEAELLQQINLGFDESWWARYETLKHKRRAETLTPQEHATLIQMSDELEQANARRLRCLIALAQLRGTTLEALMHSLGLSAPAYG